MELNAKCFPFASSSPLRIHAGHHIDVLRHIVQVIVVRHPNPRTHLSLSEVQKSEYNRVTQWMSEDSKRNIYSSLSPPFGKSWWRISLLWWLFVIIYKLKRPQCCMQHPQCDAYADIGAYLQQSSRTQRTHSQQQTECVIDAKGQQNGKMEHYPQTPRTKLNIAQYSSDKVRVALVHFWEFA